MKFFLVFLLLCFVHQNVCAYKILAFFPAPSKSHYYIGSSLMKGLAKEGHQVTVISPYKEKQPIANFTEVHLDNFLELSQKSNFLKNPTKNFQNF